MNTDKVLHGDHFFAINLTYEPRSAGSGHIGSERGRAGPSIGEDRRRDEERENPMLDTKKSLTAIATLTIAGLFAANAFAGDTASDEAAAAPAIEATEAAAEASSQDLTDEQLQDLQPAAGGAEEASEAAVEAATE